MARILTDQQALMAEDIATKAVRQEAILLGIAIANPHVALRVASDLKVDDFYSEGHQAIFGAIQDCVGRSRRVTRSTIEDILAQAGALDYVGAGYVEDITEAAPAVAAAPYALARVAEASSKRQLLRAARQIAAMALDVTCEDPVGDAIGAILAVNDRNTEDHVRHIADVMSAQVKQIQAAHEAAAAGQPPLSETGFHDVDNRIILGPGKLCIVAARPGMGKSSFAMQAARYVAQNRPVLLTSLEMDGEEIAARQIATDTRISTLDQARGRVFDSDWKKLYALPTAYADLRLYINDAPAATVAAIEAAAMRVAAKEKERMGLVVIDYLGLVDGEGRDETAKTAAISKATKGLARRLRCPVILLSQLNRAVEQRENKRPQLSDLRQSGAIEQDADVVMFIYREEYYNPETDKKGLAEIIIAKNRGGKANVSAELHWQGDSTSFANIEPKFPTYTGGGLDDGE